MRPTGGVAVVFLRALLDSGERAGVDSKRVQGALGLARSTLDDLNGWITVETMTRAWQLVPELSGDADFGIHAAETTPTGVYGVLEYATITSPTASAALERVERYYRLMGAMSEVSFSRRGAISRVSMRPIVPEGRSLRHYAEHFFTLLATRVAMLTPSHSRPRHVAFTHARPASTAEQTRIFGADVRFAQPRAELVYDTDALSGPLVTSNAELATILQQTERALSPTGDDKLVDRLKRELRGALSGGDLRVASISRRLGLSTRTLQRKLSEERASYSVIVDEVRRDVALERVRADDLSLGELAFVLGFSQASAFHRAFRRWTGTTATEFRAHPIRHDRSTNLARGETSGRRRK